MMKNAILSYFVFLCVIFAPHTLAIASSTQEDDGYESLIEGARDAMMRDPALALELAQEAQLLLANSERSSADEAQTLWLQAEAATRLGRPEDTISIVESAIALLGDTPQPSKLYGDLLTTQARAMKLTGEHGDALEMFLQAYEIFTITNEVRSQAIVLNSIGQIYNDARQYDRAIEYFIRSSERYQDLSLNLASLNNLGNAYTALQEPDAAISYFERSLLLAEEMGSDILQARILSNIASLHIAQAEWMEAEATINQAFSAVGGTTEAEWSRFLFGLRAQVDLANDRLISARNNIERVFSGLVLTDTNQHFMDFHEAAASIYASLNEHETALAHYIAFKRLDDDARNFAASANSALISAQFDFAEQELEIEHLRAEGLEAELSLERNHAEMRSLIAASSVTLLIISLISGLIVIHSLRERHKIAKRNLEFDTETGLPTRYALVFERNRMISDGNNPTFVAVVEMSGASKVENKLGFNKFVEIQRILHERLINSISVIKVALVGHGQFGVLFDSDDRMIIDDEIALLLSDFCDSVTVDGTEVDIHAVVGLACDMDSELAVRHAMIATTQAKAAMVNFAVYNPGRHGNSRDTLSLMSRMSAAMNSGGIDLYLQPKMNLKTGKISSVEALCRWNDTELGYVSPDFFITQAEETGRIRELTEWTLSSALDQKRKLASSGFDIDVAINVSGRLVADESFGTKALEILGYGISGITFEVTETAIMHHPEAAMKNLDRWVDAGIRLAIDDYGAGLSSLSYLKLLPCQELKMDKIFVKDLLTSGKDRTLIRSTIDLAHQLGIQVTAEGVEDEETLTTLKNLGCDYIQGYVLSKAIPITDLIALLQKRQRETESVLRYMGPIVGQAASTK